MPDHTYSGPGDRVYPETRDARGQHLGMVEPGEIRDLDQAPDHLWHETTDEDRAARTAVLAEREQAARDAEESGAEGGTAAEGSSGGQPENPPQDPAPKTGRRRAAGDSDTAGDAGSKEN